MGQGIAFIDRDGMGDTISRVQYNSSGTARGIEGQHSLDSHIHGRRVEGLKHDLKFADNSSIILGEIQNLLYQTYYHNTDFHYKNFLIVFYYCASSIL